MKNKNHPQVIGSYVKAKPVMVSAIQNGPSVRIIEITPEIATALMSENVSNRPLNRARVRIYTDAMKRGQWKLSGESIKRATDPQTGKKRLIDGQHRLQACIESGVPFPTVLVDELDNDVFSVIDRGKTRTVNDVMHIAGVGNFKHVAPAIRLILTLEADNNIMNSELLQCVTPDDVLKYVEDNLDSVEWAQTLGRSVDKQVGGIRSSWILFALLAEKVRGRSEVEAFAESIRAGVGLSDGNVCLALRNWLTRASSEKRSATIENTATYIKAFNAFVEGREVRVIRAWTRKSEWPTVAAPSSTAIEFEL